MGWYGAIHTLKFTQSQIQLPQQKLPSSTVSVKKLVSDVITLTCCDFLSQMLTVSCSLLSDIPVHTYLFWHPVMSASNAILCYFAEPKYRFRCPLSFSAINRSHIFRVVCFQSSITNNNLIQKLGGKQATISSFIQLFPIKPFNASHKLFPFLFIFKCQLWHANAKTLWYS